jgi:hypothetical protein
MEAFIGRYSGLVLYTREMDENAYSKICAVRFDLISLPMEILIDFVDRPISPLRVNYMLRR